MGWRWVSQGALFEIFASVGAWGRERGRCTGSLSLPPYPPPAPCSPDKSERIKSPLFFIRNSSVCLLYCNPFSLSCDIWGTNYNYDNWEPEFMTIFVTWQTRVTLDSIHNSCDAFLLCLLVQKWCWEGAGGKELLGIKVTKFNWTFLRSWITKLLVNKDFSQN